MCLTRFDFPVYFTKLVLIAPTYTVLYYSWRKQICRPWSPDPSSKVQSSRKLQVSTLALIMYYIIFVIFRLIMIAEKKTVYSKFPTPLINRLEKHFVLASSVLNEAQKYILGDLVQWVQRFSTVNDHNR